MWFEKFTVFVMCVKLKSAKISKITNKLKQKNTFQLYRTVIF